MRVNLQLGGEKLYRLAEVVNVEEKPPAYALGGRQTSKQLLLDFGEARCL